MMEESKIKFILKQTGFETPDKNIIFDLVYDDLGELVVKKTDEIFKDTSSIVTHPGYYKNNPIKFRNFETILAYDTVLNNEFGGKIRILNPIETVKYWNDIPNKDNTYRVTNGFVLYKNYHERYDDIKEMVLRALNIKPGSLEHNLIVSGLTLKRSPEKGLYLGLSDNSRIIDGKFIPASKRQITLSYDAKSGLMDSKEGILMILEPKHDGLSMIMRTRSVGLIANRYENIYYGSMCGIQLIYDKELDRK